MSVMILDVSAAIQIVLLKEKAEYFLGHYKKASWVISPNLYIPEISNVLWKYHKAKIFDHEACQQHASDGIELIDDFIETGDLWKEVLGESIKYGHPTYDLFYAVLARRHDSTLVTNDKELELLCKKMKIKCNG